MSARSFFKLEKELFKTIERAKNKNDKRERTASQGGGIEINLRVVIFNQNLLETLNKM